MMRRRTIAALAAVVALAAFATFVWPTRFRPIVIDATAWRGASAPIAAREDRFSGDVQLLVVGRGWVEAYGGVATTAGDSLRELARRYHR